MNAPNPPQPSADEIRAFEEQETYQRLDVPSAAEVARAARKLRGDGHGLSARDRLLIDWVIPLALGVIGAALLALLTWLVLIR